MGKARHPLLIISFKLLLRVEDTTLGATVFRRLANLTRGGTHVLLTAAEPDQWFPTRGNIDDVLGAQGRLQDKLQEVGGDLDGIYYVARSVFTQDRKRTSALEDILGRYKLEANEAILLSQSKAFVRAAERLGIKVHRVPDDDSATDAVLASLDALSDSP